MEIILFIIVVIFIVLIFSGLAISFKEGDKLTEEQKLTDEEIKERLKQIRQEEQIAKVEKKLRKMARSQAFYEKYLREEREKINK